MAYNSCIRCSSYQNLFTISLCSDQHISPYFIFVFISFFVMPINSDFVAITSCCYYLSWSLSLNFYRAIIGRFDIRPIKYISRRRNFRAYNFCLFETIIILVLIILFMRCQIDINHPLWQWSDNTYEEQIKLKHLINILVIKVHYMIAVNIISNIHVTINDIFSTLKHTKHLALIKETCIWHSSITLSRFGNPSEWKGLYNKKDEPSCVGNYRRI